MLLKYMQQLPSPLLLLGEQFHFCRGGCGCYVTDIKTVDLWRAGGLLVGLAQLLFTAGVHSFDELAGGAGEFEQHAQR